MKQFLLQEALTKEEDDGASSISRTNLNSVHKVQDKFLKSIEDMGSQVLGEREEMELTTIVNGVFST